MSLAINPQGITIDTYNDIFSRLVEGYKAIYGQDIAVDADTADGQRIGIEAKAQLDLQTALLYLYTSLDIDQAKGEALNRAIKYCGIARRAATKSTWDINVTVSQAVTLNDGYTIKDNAGQEWITTTDQVLTAGTHVVSFESVTLGAVVGLIGSTFEQVTVVLGVSSFSATVSANVGFNEETDEQLRLRRIKSLQNPAYSTIGAITAKIFAVDNVTDVVVYENYTDSYDSDLDLAAHSIWCVVEGGDVDLIAEAIARQKTAGTGLKGSVVGTFLETLTNGRVITHLMNFDRTTYVDIYVRMDATRTTSVPVDTALIAQNLAAHAFKIGEPVDAYALYEIAVQGFKGAYLTGLEISVDNVTFTSGRLAVINGGKYVINAINVTVNEIIP